MLYGRRKEFKVEEYTILWCHKNGNIVGATLSEQCASNGLSMTSSSCCGGPIGRAGQFVHGDRVIRSLMGCEI